MSSGRRPACSSARAAVRSIGNAGRRSNKAPRGRTSGPPDVTVGRAFCWPVAALGATVRRASGHGWQTAPPNGGRSARRAYGRTGGAGRAGIWADGAVGREEQPAGWGRITPPSVALESPSCPTCLSSYRQPSGRQPAATSDRVHAGPQLLHHADPACRLSTMPLSCPMLSLPLWRKTARRMTPSRLRGGRMPGEPGAGRRSRPVPRAGSKTFWESRSCSPWACGVAAPSPVQPPATIPQ